MAHRPFVGAVVLLTFALLPVGASAGNAVAVRGIRVAQFVPQGEKLIGADEQIDSGFGFRVAVSSDGRTALIGAPQDNGAVGAAWVFTRIGSEWRQQGGKLVARDETGHGSFGSDVALSADGDAALIGGASDGNVGAVWVFTRSGSTWSQQGPKLTGGGEVGDAQFGGTVALSADGNTALIGASYDHTGVGAAWVFTRTPLGWRQQGAKLTASDEIGLGWFGGSVALSGDGNTALIGISDINGAVGSAWVFTRNGSTWTQQGGRLTAGAGDDGFGSSVALSADGNTAVSGSNGGVVWVLTRSGSTWTPAATLSNHNEGLGGAVALSADGTTVLVGAGGFPAAAWVFTLSGVTWRQQARLTGNDASRLSFFGESVAISANADIALAGGAFEAGGAGAAWAFGRSGSTWTQQGPRLTGRGAAASGEFGWSVALSANGSTAIVGGPDDASKAGAAWVFVRRGENWQQQGPKLIAGPGLHQSQLQFGWSVALSADGNTALVGSPLDGYIGLTGQSAGSAAVFTRSGSTWTRRAKLVGRGRIGPASFGDAVALSADGRTALVGGPVDDGQRGAAWVFTRTTGGWKQQGRKLTGRGEAGGGWFGTTVALSADGTTALIGGPLDRKGVGAAWVFTRAGPRWVQEGEKLTGSGETGAGEFGFALALSADGSTALVGAPKDSSEFGYGAAWVLTRSGSIWAKQGPKLSANPVGAIAAFGSSVALSADGRTALIGSEFDNRGIGSVALFGGSPMAREGPKLTGHGEIGFAEFGRSVALSADGTTALVGAPFDLGHTGAAWAFRSG